MDDTSRKHWADAATAALEGRWADANLSMFKESMVGISSNHELKLKCDSLDGDYLAIISLSSLIGSYQSLNEEGEPIPEIEKPFIRRFLEILQENAQYQR